MTINDEFLVGLKAYQEIQAEIQKEKTSPGAALAESGQGEAGKLASLPPAGSILLGLAEDGLPLILDLYDPTPGPLLVAGDAGSGKTAVLQSIARASNLADPGDIQFGVITPFPEEWTHLEHLPNGMGIWPAYHPSSNDFLKQLVQWAEALGRTRQVILLLVDGLDLLAGSSVQSQEDLHWLLVNGPERQIWPVVSVNPAHLHRLFNWLKLFNTRIIGRVKLDQHTQLLAGNSQANLADFTAGVQFGLSQGEGWLKFVLPPLL